MKKLLVSILFVLTTLFLFPNIVLASGTTNDSDVVLQKGEDGVYYLTTESVGETSPVLLQNKVQILEGIVLPAGFAENLDQWISAVLTLILAVAAILVLGNLIWGAILWITSGGDKGKIDQARSRMVASVIGLIITASAFAVFTVIIRFLGFDSVSEVFRVKTLDGNGSAQINSASESGTLKESDDTFFTTTTTTTQTKGAQ